MLRKTKVWATCSDCELELSEGKLLESLNEEQSEELNEEPPEVPRIDLEDIIAEMTRMGVYLDRVQRRLNLQPVIPKCPELDPCVDNNIELNGSANAEIRKLQRNNYRLQHQLDELLQCPKIADQQIVQLDERYCIQQKQLRNVQIDYEALHSWIMLMDREFAICRQRYTHLRQIKANWTYMESLKLELKRCWELCEKHVIERPYYICKKRSVLAQLADTQTFCGQVLQVLFQKYRTLEMCTMDSSGKCRECIHHSYDHDIIGDEQRDSADTLSKRSVKLGGSKVEKLEKATDAAQKKSLSRRMKKLAKMKSLIIINSSFSMEGRRQSNEKRLPPLPTKVDPSQTWYAQMKTLIEARFKVTKRK